MRAVDEPIVLYTEAYWLSPWCCAVWVTLQAHLNIVAVAALLEMSAVIITEGAQPEAATIAKANAEGITLLATDKQSFEVVGRLWEMGLR